MVRQGWGRHTTVATGSDSGDQVSVNAWNADIDKDGMLGFTGETIASATSITPTNSTIILSGSTNVSTIAQGNSAEYDLLYVFTSGSVTLVNTASPSSAGDIKLLANVNKALSSTVPTILIRKGTAWFEYGGGITNALNDIGNVVITSVANEDVLAYDTATSKWINQTADETGRVTADSTTTFTNKTIDQDGTGNSITNIADASIKASAAIAQSKIANLTTDLAAKSPLAGSSSIVTVGTIVTGVWNGTAIADGYLGTGINALKLADGTITNTELQYINTLSSNAQTQIDSKSPTAGNTSLVTLGTITTGTWTGTAVAKAYVSGSPTGDYVGTSDTQTLTAKTLTNPALGASYIDITRMSAPANPSANDGRIYTKQIDSNNDGLFIKIKKAAGFVEVQIV